MGKSDSIKMIEDLGLNSLEHVITKDPKVVKEFIKGKEKELLSMRTERGSEYSCPFFYKIPGKTLLNQALEHLAMGYTLIFSRSLDTKGCLAFGSIAVGTGEDIVEFVIGEGKVREMETHPNLQSVKVTGGRMLAVLDKDYPGKAYIINKVYRIIKDISYDLPPSVFEWSYYSVPVGRLGHNEIFWEIRPFV